MRWGARRMPRTMRALMLALLALLAAGAPQAVAAPDVIITPSGPTLAVTEGGSGDSYWMVLSESPAPGETVTVTPDGGTELAAMPPTVEFTDVDWSVSQLVTLTAVDDAVSEGSHQQLLAHHVTSGDPSWNGLFVPPLLVDITDNDPFGLVVTEDAGITQVTENGGYTDQYQLVLDQAPTDTVTVTITGDTQVQTDVTSLTFTPFDWNVPQTVQVAAPDDMVTEGTHAGFITHDLESLDAWYDGRPSAGVTVSILDDDYPGLAIAESGGATVGSEGAASGDDYTVRLTTAPSQPVTVTIDPGPQAEVDGGVTQLDFDASNWSTPQTVSVSPIDDDVAEGSHSATITHTITSSDPDYAAISSYLVWMQITDNDAAGFLVTHTGGTTDVFEGGAGDTYDVRLTSRPVANVVVSVSPDTQVNSTPATLTFTPLDWSSPQPINVTAVDDPATETPIHAGAVSHSFSGDAAYAALAPIVVPVSVSDNDTPAVLVTPTDAGTAVAEGGPGDDYTVVLATQPSANVTITITAPGDLTTSPTSLTFTPANWNQARTVGVTATQDLLTEGPETHQITHSAASMDPAYGASLPVPSITVHVADDDIPGVIIVESAGTSVTEGGATDTYDVKLAAQPNQDVFIDLVPSGEVMVSPGSLTFTAANWSVAQTVTVTPVDDQTAEGVHTGSITHAVTSTDPAYGAVTGPILTVSITDNDAAGVVLTPASGTLAVKEGGTTATYTLVLARRPLADVQITAEGHGQVVADPASVTFTPANWNTPKTVTMSAVDDDVDESETHAGLIEHTAKSSHALYDNIPVGKVNATVTDNDTANVAVVQEGGTTVAEAGAVDTVSFVLLSRPSADVTISLEHDNQITLSAKSVTIPASAWAEPRKVTITAVDDKDAEGQHSSSIPLKVSSGDAAYAAIKLSNVDVTINDNEKSGGSNQDLVVGENGESDGSSADDEGEDAVPVGTTKQPAKPSGGDDKQKPRTPADPDQGGQAQRQKTTKTDRAKPPEPAAEAEAAAKPAAKPPAEESDDKPRKKRGTPLWERVVNWTQDHKPIVGGLGLGALAMAFASLMLRGVGTASSAAAAASAADAAGAGRGRPDGKAAAKERKLAQQERKVAQKQRQAEQKARQKEAQREAKARRAEREQASKAARGDRKK